MRAVLLALAAALLPHVVVTSYTLECGGCTGVTSSGRLPVAGVTVACPRPVACPLPGADRQPWAVRGWAFGLPAGTRVYVRGLGWRRCDDTGGAIGGQRLDDYAGSGEHALARAIDWGRRRVLAVALPPEPKERP